MKYTTHTTHHPRLSTAVVRARVPRPVGRPAALPGALQRRRLPKPRLTGLGCGVLATACMLAVGWFCHLLGGMPVLYGVLFVLTATAAALWVRPADLVCAPIAAPIAFAMGLAILAGPGDMVTELALRAPWVFGGTLLSALIVLARKGLALLRHRLRERRRLRHGWR